VQYHSPVWRACTAQGLELQVIYGSDFSIAGYRDAGFNVSFKWDVDLLSGYPSHFLRTLADGGGKTYETVSGKGLAESIKQINPRAILVLGYHSRFDRAAINAARAAKIPIVFRAETSDLGARSGFRALLRDTYLRFLYRRIDAFCYIGVNSKRHFLRLGVPEHKLFSAPYCVDATHFRFDPAVARQLRREFREELRASDQDVVLLFSGKLLPLKAPDMLLAAAASLPEAWQQRLIVAFLGDGELRAALTVQADRLKFRTSFLGFQNQSKLSRFYHGADLLALPTRTSETWGLVVNEALLHGLPVLTSDTVGSAADLITEQTGITFQCGNQQDLNRQLLALLERLPVLRREDCQSQVSKYSVEIAAQGIAQAYEYVTKGKRDK